jgi:hypothetical protein
VARIMSSLRTFRRTLAWSILYRSSSTLGKADCSCPWMVKSEGRTLQSHLSRLEGRGISSQFSAFRYEGSPSQVVRAKTWAQARPSARRTSFFIRLQILRNVLR